MRVCLAYDCLYPYTVGGGERWYRKLAERLAAEGHEVTYLTLRQWERGDEPHIQGVEVIAVGPRMELYSALGRRRIAPALAFGAGLLSHLLRRGGRYDVVHTAALQLSVPAVAAARSLHAFRLVVDWFEVWTRNYWREYLGTALGWAAGLVQSLAIRIPHDAVCLSELHARRLHEAGFRGTVIRVGGIYEGRLEAPAPLPAEPVVVFLGRHIPEKQVPALIPALAEAKRTIPQLRAEIYGDGPERGEVLRLIRAYGLEGDVQAPGFVERERLERALARALCLVLPSRREGFGIVVLEAAAKGVPSIVVDGADNAAVELLDDGENGVVARSSAPGDLAEAIVRVQRAGDSLRVSTAAWFGRNAARLSLARSVETLLEAYGAA